MSSRFDFDRDVADIQALMGDTRRDPAWWPGDKLADAELARLTQIRQDVTAVPRTPGRRRTWWPIRPQRRHRRLVISCVALPVLLGATAAGWVVASSSPAIRVAGMVYCHGPQRQQVTYMTTSDGSAPTELCARFWAGGQVTGRPVRHVPRLVACALPISRNPGSVNQGGVGVFPDTTCAALHLRPLPAGYREAARQLSDLERYLQAGQRDHCRSVPAADAYARGALARFGFTGWVISHPWGSGPPPGFGPQGCWEAQADGAARALQVLPAPGKYPTPPAARGPLRVMARVLAVPAPRCGRGDPPQHATAAARMLRAALSQAGYGRWRILVSRATSPTLPCYRTSWYSLSRRAVYISATAYTKSPQRLRRPS